MKSNWIAFLALIPLVLGGTYRSCYGPGEPGSREARAQLKQPNPGWFSERINFAWRRLGRLLFSETRRRSEALHAFLLKEVKKIPSSDLGLSENDSDETDTEENYGKLPEVRVDEGIPAIFPLPRAAPHRTSWFSVAAGSRHALRKISQLESRASLSIGNTQALAQMAADWSAVNAEIVTLAEQVRYLEFWEPELLAQWRDSASRGELPAKTMLTRALDSDDPIIFESLRELLKPRRVLHRSFLPETLEDAEAGLIEIPIATDVTNRKFRAEVEGAVDTYWNQSSWAGNQGISFHITWKSIPFDKDFAAGKTDLEHHLQKFPVNMAAMTTGGLTTHVFRQALVLGPGKINPRGLAHEVGHLMGFPDCYLRTLNGQGIFGLAILEWDNPLYPDDIMCDNVVGVPRAEVW